MRTFPVLILAFVGFQAQAANATGKPNVIIVMTDDQGYGDLSCHGNPVLKTPHLDQLYSESIRFADFHVSPFCTPTRASLMTGNNPGFTGAYRTSSGRTMMHRDEKTVADLFSSAGYVTGMVGKWHLGDNAPHRPQDRGFQDVVWHRCGGIGQASDYWGNDYFDDTYERNGKFEKFEGYCTDVWFREGIRFIEKNRSKPFLLYLATNAPHGPYHVPAEWAKPYVGNKAVVNANFYGMIANLDHNMGILRRRLTKLGLAENTILIFMTDNGTAAGGQFMGLDSEPSQGFNAGMRGKKSSVFDGGHRVPFFVYWPKGNLTGGKDIETLAAHIDVLPTLADLCDIPVPEDYKPDGVSLKPLLYESDQPWARDHHVVQFHGGAGAKTLPSKPYEYSVVMTERWRLVNSGGQYLYDIQSDPAQRTNLAEKHPEVVEQLRGHYDPFWKEVSPRLRPVRIDVGNPSENPTVLCSQDWYMPTGNPPWHFSMIKKLPKVTGPWMLQVQNAGRYRITLRQFPKAANKPVVAKRAKIEIAGRTLEQPVKAGSKGVVFELDLPAGPTELVTYLYDKTGKAGGAYFTELEALETQTSLALRRTNQVNLDGAADEDAWIIDSQAEWKRNTATQTNLVTKEGVASPTGKTATFRSIVKAFETKRSAKSLVFDQSPIWQNWEPVKNVGPSNLQDAPVALTLGPDNYWMFGRYGSGLRRRKGQKPPPFTPKTATLEGFDIPLQTTRFPNQYNAPGGLKPSKGGYHAWQSRDMVNWVHHGPVTEGFSRWVTSAEHIDGKTLIYYDFPNDQDPHVYVDDDLTDGEPGVNKGKALDDPSHGSDAGFIRDLDGKVHVIFEDWSPINASKRSWDSPLAGHAVSPNGIEGFEIKAPAVDKRTKPTGEKRTYKHPHWAKEDPKNYKTNVAEYEVHEPEQEAYGDWASICIGGQYYLFGDYDPVGGHNMSVGWFTSPSIDQQFTWCDKIGNGHPDPDICFAEGRFYLVTQQATDYTSPGPWVEKVETRVGVDTDKDGKIDHWSDWQTVKETYDYTPGFAKQIQKTPASVDLSNLPAGYGFQFEVRMTDTTENKSKPMLDKVTLTFQ